MISPRTTDSGQRRRKYVSIERIEHMVRKGIANGYCRPRPAHEPERFRRAFEMRLDMDCHDPYVYTLWSRYHADTSRGTFIMCDVHTRCRKCDACRERHNRYWAARAVTEYQRNPATWMFTLTLRPEEHYLFDAEMHKRWPELNVVLGEQAGSPGLAAATLFQHRAWMIGSAVTKYLKRLRHYTGPEKLRTLVVAEAHAKGGTAVAGRPHFHLLIHERERGVLIPDTDWKAEEGLCTRCNRWHETGEVCDHALVRTAWRHGFTKVVRCMDERSAYYVCKYIDKGGLTRVRSSIGYGIDDPTEKVGENSQMGVREVLTPREGTVL